MTCITLREAFERHYDISELSRDSERKFHHHLLVWERKTNNPPVNEIDNATIAQFRQAMIDHPYSASSIKGVWTSMRSILRRLAPPFTGNPAGLGLIDSVPYFKPVKGIIRRPYRVPLPDISRAYVACRAADYRIGGIPASDWFRTLIVLAYCTALRRGDLWSLEWNQVELADKTLWFVAAKTGKELSIPLHDVAVEHLQRIERKAGLVLPGTRARFYVRWKAIQEHAGIKRRFCLHDLRRTSASEFDRARHGLGGYLLQHAPQSVTEKFYLNRDEELRHALDELRLPDGFRAGPKMADRQAEKRRQERIEIHGTDFSPIAPVASDWQFKTGAVAYRGKWYSLRYGLRYLILQTLVTADGAVSCEQLIQVISGYRGTRATPLAVRQMISGLRKWLRATLCLDPADDPVPCLSRGQGGFWSIWIPRFVNMDHPTGKRSDDRAGDWIFHDAAFEYRGRHTTCWPSRVRLLKLLVTSDVPVPKDRAAKAVGCPRVSDAISELRMMLRRLLELPLSVDPIPRVKDCHGTGTAWKLEIPPSAGDSREDAA